MTPKTIRGFAVVYALLFLVLIGSGLGAYAAYTLPSKASAAGTAKLEHWRGKEVAAIRRQLGDRNLTRVTNAYVTRIAAGQGFSVKKVTILSVAVKGNTATVTVRAVLANPYGGDQTYTLKVNLNRGVWQATGAAAA